MVIIDTHVLVDVREDDPDWADWSIGRMRVLSKIHELAINPVIYVLLTVKNRGYLPLPGSSGRR